jgi:Ca-activated chloride channel family protein
MRKIILVGLFAAGAAHAEGVLSGADGLRFPTSVDVAVAVEARVEMTTMVLTFDPIAAGDYVLTVPTPEHGYVIGVDLDRGDGWKQSYMASEAPPPALGGDPVAQDPTVSAWLGLDPLRADLSGLGAGPLKMRVRFERLLRSHLGVVAFDTGARRCPLRDAADPGAAITYRLDLRTFRALSQLTATGAPSTVSQRSTTGTVIASATGDLGESITYAEVPNDIDVHVLVHRTPTADPLGGADGYFMAVIDAAEIANPPPRTIGVVIDRSGSMEGAKIAQAQGAAQAMLDLVHPTDKFEIVSFADDVATTGLLDAADVNNVNMARDFVTAIAAGGGTDIDLGMTEAITNFGGAPQQFDALVLLSDGEATSGVTDDSTIASDVAAANTMGARIFTFAVGTGADVQLLEALARDSRGRGHILNDAEAAADLEAQARGLFEDIDTPRLTNVTVTVSGVDANAMLPQPMVDVFGGGQAILVGRYATPGTATLHITGSDDGAPFTRDVSFDASALEPDNEPIEYVWATEQVGELLAKMATGGDWQSLQDQIVKLGLGYRIQTPYTSFTSANPNPAGSGSGGTGGTGGSGGSGTGSTGGGGWSFGDATPPARTPILLFVGLGVAIALVGRRWLV